MAHPLVLLAGLTIAAADMPPLDGLCVWLDAAYEAQLRGRTPTLGPVVLDRWRGRSPHGHAFTQPRPELRPLLVPVGEHWVVRFTGTGEFLQSRQPGLTYHELSLFVVARPTGNQGGFRAFISAGAVDGDDYRTGFNLDLGPDPTGKLQAVNAEGAGFSGVHNLLLQPRPLGRLRVITLIASRNDRRVHLLLEGRPQGQRAWSPTEMRADVLTVAARRYALATPQPTVRGFLQGDIAEILIYRRAVSEEEQRQILRYLRRKYRPLAARFRYEPLPTTGKPTVKNPPAVQMLVPGFTVHELPVELNNINNVRYRQDGTLVALGYDGRIYLLRDRDGDGLEESVELFWDGRGKLIAPIGMALTPKGYPHGQGVIVASKGKVSLIVDRDGDDRADAEQVIASGWKPLQHGVDALGVAIDREGNIYFGLGTADFANPYQLDEEGRSHYRIDSPRGTIQKVSADFTRRETVCTGIRFSVALAFNRFGDLFCTDQEGATWLPNGNPFDELLWIRPGRHYGFPPRHPKYLPDVVDEPSLYDYGPQHQSTCGLFFNEPLTPGGPVFGPPWWRGDAIVCGASRGILFRTKLARTVAGYVAVTQIIGRLQHLTIDACLGPSGELVVATHGGMPDWGTGPEGKGKLYKIRPVSPPPPRPVWAYASARDVVKIVFDQALSDDQFQALRDVTISYGRFVRAGERYETLAPPYRVVQVQLAAPRYRLPVRNVKLTGNRRVVVLETDAHSAAVHYAVRLRWPRKHQSGIKQEPFVDVGYTLHGARLTVAKERQVLWSDWVPHVDLDAARELTVGSWPHERLWRLQAKGTVWRLLARLKLDHLLTPRVQMGSELDYTPTPETVTLRFWANCPLDVKLEGAQPSAKGRDPLPPILHEQTPSKAGWWLEFVARGPRSRGVEVTLRPTDEPPRLSVLFRTARDRRWRPLPAQKVLLPWASEPVDRVEVTVRGGRLRGASWGRGRRIFFGPKVACSRCHRIRGQGGNIGPDLSNLIHRDYESVRRDIVDPNHTINPDYVTHVVLLKDGRILTGTIRTDRDDLLIGQTDGTEVRVARDDVELIKPTGGSIMPTDIAEQLTERELNDLLAFLLLPPPRMPLDPEPSPPPPRDRSEVLQIVTPRVPSADVRPLTIVLVAGPKDHGPNEHDYPAWQRVWAELLRSAPGVKVVSRWQWPDESDYDEADVIVFYKRMDYRREEGPRLDRFLARGGGLVLIHWAVHGGEAPEELAKRIGLARAEGLRYRHGPVRLLVPPDQRQHPIVRGLHGLRLVDETYWNLIGDRSGITVLAESVEDGQGRPQVWIAQRGKGRVFVCIPGHYSWTFDDPLYRLLLVRGIAWAAGEPVDRFETLVFPGARMQ